MLVQTTTLELLPHHMALVVYQADGALRARKGCASSSYHWRQSCSMNFFPFAHALGTWLLHGKVDHQAHEQCGTCNQF